MCPCPETVESGHSYAQRCALDPRSQDVICECETGYSGNSYNFHKLKIKILFSNFKNIVSGARCDQCSENYFGNPEVKGGNCTSCNCNNNVDISKPGNCDPSSGKCLQCIFNTEGFNCEFCRAGFYGDALTQSCRGKLQCNVKFKM